MRGLLKILLITVPVGLGACDGSGTNLDVMACINANDDNSETGVSERVDMDRLCLEKFEFSLSGDVVEPEILWYERFETDYIDIMNKSDSFIVTSFTITFNVGGEFEEHRSRNFAFPKDFLALGDDAFYFPCSRRRADFTLYDLDPCEIVVTEFSAKGLRLKLNEPED